MADDHLPNDATDRPRASEPELTDTARGLRHRVSTKRPRLAVGRGVTTAAVIVATAAGAAAIGVVAGLLTLFGWGAAIVVAILAIGVVAAIRPRPANGWLLVPLLALALPSAAVAISGVRVLPERGRVVETPTTVAEIPDKGFRAGLGDLLVDLRSLEADGRDEIVVRAGSDLGRTVVALPQKRCFNLDVRWRAGDFRLPRVRERPTVVGLRPERTLAKLGSQLPGNRKRIGLMSGRIVLFGRAHRIDEGRWVAPTADQGAPTLTIELASEGGSFVVRDYPDHVSPLQSTGWPIDQSPIPRNEAALTAAIRREERTIIAAQRREIPPNERNQALQAELADEVGIAAQNRVARRINRGIRAITEAFGRDWARRVTGTCNPRGTFR